MSGLSGAVKVGPRKTPVTYDTLVKKEPQRPYFWQYHLFLMIYEMMRCREQQRYWHLNEVVEYFRRKH